MTKPLIPKRRSSLPKANVDAYLDKIVSIIKAHGWAVQAVMTNPLVAYTVGLTLKHDLPELVVSGLPYETAQSILNELARKLIENKFKLEEDKDYDEVFEGFNARFRELSAAEARELKIAALFTAEDAPVVAWQLLWPDPNGRFPDNPKVDEQYAGMQDLELIFSEPDSASPH